MMQKYIDAWNISSKDFPVHGSLREQMFFLLRYAILAPSTHNTQPWRFRLTDTGCELHCDPRLRLPFGDPTGRDFYISLGHALEFFILAAKRYGMYTDVSYRTGEGTCVAEVRCQKSEGYNDSYERLVAMIPKRSNARGFFKKQAVPKSILEELSAVVQNGYGDTGVRVDFVVDPDAITRIARLTADGVKMARRDSNFRKEFSAWFHHNFSKRYDGIPGYAVGMPNLVSVVMAPLMRWFSLNSLLGKLNYRSVAGTPLICVLSGKDGKHAWLDVGRISGRLMLELLARDIRTSVYVASVEIGMLHTQLQEITGSPDRPQFLFIGGSMDRVAPHAPRHPVQEKIITH